MLSLLLKLACYKKGGITTLFAIVSECELNERSRSNARNTRGELCRVGMVLNRAASSSVMPVVNEQALAKVAEEEAFKLKAEGKSAS